MLTHKGELSCLIDQGDYNKLLLYVSLGFDLTLADINHDYVAKYGYAENKAFDYAISNNFSSLRKVKQQYLDVQNNNGYSPLHWAIISHNNTIVRYLIDSDVDIQSRTITNETAFSLAARFNNSEAFFYLLKQLIRRKEHLLTKNEKGFTPLHFACSHKNLKLITAIFKICPRNFVTHNNVYGATSLHWLVHGVKVQDNLKSHLLQIFCEKLNQIFSFRLARDMLNMRNALGLKPLDWLEIYNHQQCYQFLKRRTSI